jgi:chorismate dehydratase
MSKLRVGIVNYLNSKPLAWGFLKGHHRERFEISFHPPAQVADRLRDGELDIGLVPSIELQRIPDLKVLPDLCIAATHEVRSVLVVSRVPVGDIRRVALDENSRTSAALVRLVLEDGHGLRPEYVEHRADLDSMLAAADAALLIGDPALRVERKRYRVLDLAAEWRRLTGHPFVFAVWAARPSADVQQLPFYFKSSLRYGLSSLEALVRECAKEMELEVESVREYLTQNLTYLMRQEELAGLREFYDRAAAKGLIESAQPLEFWRPAPIDVTAG